MCFTEQSFVKMHFETTELISSSAISCASTQTYKTKTAHIQVKNY